MLLVEKEKLRFGRQILTLSTLETGWPYTRIPTPAYSIRSNYCSGGDCTSDYTWYITRQDFEKQYKPPVELSCSSSESSTSLWSYSLMLSCYLRFRMMLIGFAITTRANHATFIWEVALMLRACFVPTSMSNAALVFSITLWRSCNLCSV